MKTLYPQQVKARDTLITALENHGAALDSSDTGTGKTLKSVEIARLASNPALVICPKSVIPAWREAFAEQGVAYNDVLNYEQLRTGKTRHGNWITERGIKKFRHAETSQFIIWDEVHRCKGVDTQTGKMLAHAKGRCNLMLSATAAEDPTELKNIGYLVELFPDLRRFRSWAKRNGCYMDPWRNLQFAKGKREMVLRELNLQLYPERGHRLTREELSEFFQETHIITEPLDFGDAGKIESIFATMDTELAEIDDARARDSENSGAAAMTAMLRARQEAEILKVPLLVEMAQDYIAEGFSIAIFLNFNASIEAVCAQLPGTTPKIWGSQTGEERTEAIAQFQSNKAQAIVCNITAGGVGVNLHDELGGHPRIALISPSWNAKEIVQVTGRVDRAGGKTPTIQRILFSAGTVEETIRKSVDEKLTNLHLLHQKHLT